MWIYKRVMKINQAGVLFCCAALFGCATADTGGTLASAIPPDQALAKSGTQSGGLTVVTDLPTPPSTAGGVEQPVAAADILDITVFQVPDLSRKVQVDDAGSINLPLIGTMQAAGQPVRVLEQQIRSAYGKEYLQSPQVSVQVTESAARRVTVDGEVNRAGVFPLPPTASLLDAIALAGSFKTIADPDKVYVFRQIGNRTLVANYSVSQIRQGRKANPRLYGGDKVVVFASQSRVAMQNLRDVLGVASSATRLAVIP